MRRYSMLRRARRRCIAFPDLCPEPDYGYFVHGRLLPRKLGRFRRRTQRISICSPQHSLLAVSATTRPLIPPIHDVLNPVSRSLSCTTTGVLHPLAHYNGHRCVHPLKARRGAAWAWPTSSGDQPTLEKAPRGGKHSVSAMEPGHCTSVVASHCMGINPRSRKEPWPFHGNRSCFLNRS